MNLIMRDMTRIMVEHANELPGLMLLVCIYKISYVAYVMSNFCTNTKVGVV